MNEDLLRGLLRNAGIVNAQAVLEMDRPVTIRVDVDGTICTRPKGTGYDQSRPIPEMIRLINGLHEAGWWVVYWTSRGARTGTGYAELTRQQLEKWGCKYAELKLDKPPTTSSSTTSR